MKNVYAFIICLFVAAVSFGQAPEKMSYQAVVRDNGNILVSSTTIGLQISVLQGSPSGTVEYVETHSPSTNENGLFSVEIGMGSLVSGDFGSIDWSNGPFFLKTETDPEGGDAYSIEGTSELLSVPFSLHANTASGIVGTELVPNGATPGEMVYWDGSSWLAVAPGENDQNLTFCNGVPTWGPCPPPVQLGDSTEGGYIFYILQDGDVGFVEGETHGLIAAGKDVTTGQRWGTNNVYIGSAATAIGTGEANTIAIAAGMSGSANAAQDCLDFDYAGFQDWFLPSREELAKLYDNQDLVPGIFPNYYWSSSEYDTVAPWNINMTPGAGIAGVAFPKQQVFPIRAIRYF